jgi:hypothetical protein
MTCPLKGRRVPGARDRRRGEERQRMLGGDEEALRPYVHAHTPDYRIRQASVSDAPVIARHRVSMFQDVGRAGPGQGSGRGIDVAHAPGWPARFRRVRWLARGNRWSERRGRGACCCTSTIQQERIRSAGPARTSSVSIRSRDTDDKASRINSSRRLSPGAGRTISREPACTRLGSAGQCTNDSGLSRSMR